MAWSSKGADRAASRAASHGARHRASLTALTGLLAALAALTCALVATAGAAPRAQRPIPDVTVLFNRAVKIVRHAHHGMFARAVMLEAEGRTRGSSCSPRGCTAGRPATKAAGVVAWRFVLQNSTPGSPYASVVVDYGPAPSRWGHVVGHKEPFLEDVAIRHAPKMTLRRAVRRLRQAGYRDGFVDVTLRNPLGPRPSNPEYIFGMANGTHVAVDTRTGRVKPLR